MSKIQGNSLNVFYFEGLTSFSQHFFSLDLWELFDKYLFDDWGRLWLKVCIPSYNAIFWITQVKISDSCTG